MVSVYLIKAGGTNNYKIGISNDTNNRLNSLQTAHYEKLSIVHERAYTNRFMALIVEEELHSKYKKNNIMGECFLLDPIHIKDIIEVLNKNISEVLSLKARVRELEETVKRMINNQEVQHKNQQPLQQHQEPRKRITEENTINRLWKNGVIKTAEKLTPKKDVININKRKEVEKLSKIYKALIKVGAIELRGNKGYYALKDYDEALELFRANGGAK